MGLPDSICGCLRRCLFGPLVVRAGGGTTTEGSPSIGFALGAAAMEIVATYTMSNGVICGVVMIFLGLTLRAHAVLTASIAMLAASLLFAYFFHFHALVYQSPPGFVFEHPDKFIEYTIVYLGSPAGRFGFATAGLLGTLGLALTLFAAVRMILHREQNPARAAMAGVMIFIVLTAAATAFGRAFFGLDQALSGRYFTPVGVFWSAQIIFWSSFARPTLRNWPASAIFVAVSLAAVTGAVRAHFAERSLASEHFRNLNLASDALLSGVEMNDAMRLIYFDPEEPRRDAPFLDEQHLSIFSWPRLGCAAGVCPTPSPRSTITLVWVLSTAPKCRRKASASRRRVGLGTGFAEPR